MRVKRTFASLVASCALSVPCATNAQPNPPDPALLVSGWQIPFTVAMPQDVAAGPLAPQQPFFDDFSWRSFIGLNWPAALGPGGAPLRGVPDQRTPIANKPNGARTWETWKSAWELFKPTQDPTPFEEYDGPPAGCPQIKTVKQPQRVFVMASKAGSLIDADLDQALSGPLIDQNRNYVRYEIKFNKTQYDVIRDNRWFIASNLPTQVDFPSSVQVPTPAQGAIELKAAWRELIENQDDFSRYYWTEAHLLEPGNPMTCRSAKLGLIGLHIVHKVSPFREWIWSTFEHIDNVPDPGRPAPKTYSLNNGTAVPVTVNGYNYPPIPNRPPESRPRDQPLPAKSDIRRTPVQVTRFTPIRTDTQQINAAYQKLLHGTPWEFYQALPTQWPTVRRGAQFKPNGAYPGDSGNPFPVAHVANTAAETYFQNSGSTSCMQCHYSAAMTDFSWVLALRASPTTPASIARRETVLEMLRNAVK